MTRVGLVGPGSLGRSIASALPLDRYQLGPVASSSFVSARRAAREMRRGWPAESLTQMADADCILLFPPEQALSDVLQELQESINLKGKTVVFAHPTAVVDPDLGARAHACRLTPLASFQHPAEDLAGIYFFLEGSPSGVRHARRLLRECKARVVAAPLGSAVRVAAAASTAGDAVTALVGFAVELLVDSGLPQKRAIDALEPLVAGVLADYARARGKIRPSLPLATRAPLVRERLEALSALDDTQAQTYHRVLRLTQELSGRNCGDDIDAGE